MNAQDVEVAVARHFDGRVNTIVPNVSWGMGLGYEADMLVVSQAGYVTEVEIKVSMSDLKKDKEKRHQHDAPFLKKVYFAVPESMGDVSGEVSEHFGILSVKPWEGHHYYYGQVVEVRKPRTNKNAPKLTTEQINKMQALAVMRLWNLKEKVVIERSRKQASHTP